MKTRDLAAQAALAWLCQAMTPAMAAAPLNPVLGRVDGIATTGSGEVLLVGWACYKGWSWSSPQVDVYAGAPAGQGGTKLGVYQTNQPSEAAVSQHCETSGINHRFNITLTISMRQQFAGKALYVYGFAYPGQGNNILLNGSGQFTVPAAPAVADSIYYIHADRLGSNVVMTDTNANVVARTEYTAYGAAAQNTSKNETAGYTGHYEDPLTGLTYMQARYYDADLGRFISIDPVGATPGDVFNFARYAYANNNPMMFTDPTGMVVQACKSDAVINADGSWSVTGSGCMGGSGGSGGVAGWFPVWGGGAMSPPREPGAIGGGGGLATEPTIIVTAAAPAKVGWGSGTLLAGLSGSLILGGGPTGGIGFMINPGLGDNCFDFGFYATGGLHAGANVGASGNLAYVQGSSSNVSGTTFEQYIGVSRWGVSASWKGNAAWDIFRNKGPFRAPDAFGGSVGIGIPYTYSTGVSHTVTASTNDVLKFFGYDRCGH